MHVSSFAADRLTVESRPWLLGVVLGLVILFLAGLAIALASVTLWAALGLGFGAAVMGVMFAVFVRRVIVIFDRPAGAVVIRTATLRGQTEQTLPLGDITRAAVETSRSTSRRSNGGTTTSTTHRPVLHTRTGTVPLTIVSSSGRGADQVADAINRWLAGPDLPQA